MSTTAASPRRSIDQLSTLNLGSGRRPFDDAVNLDVTSTTAPDVAHDLNVFPWPFPDDRFTRILANDVLEHLDDLVRTMEEIHRICADGARIEIGVPHYSAGNAFTDPTHRHYFGYFSFDYFTGEHEHNYYTTTRFRLVKRRIGFYPAPLEPVVRRLAHRSPERYERRWAWIYPAWYLRFELEVVK
jgi:SAM-dependent methyltransferase